MKTALIILTYNNCDDTIACVRSVLQYNTAPIRIIVVDNASEPKLQRRLRNQLAQICPGTTYVESSKNLGYARGNNLGLEIAYGDPTIDYVMVLNNDVLFIQDIIPGLIEIQRSTPDSAIVSPILLKADQQSYDYNCARRNESVSDMMRRNMLHYWWRYKGKNPNQIFKRRYMLHDIDMACAAVPIELPSGSCMLARKDLFQKIGGFDPNTFLYYEENILYRKIEKLGLKNYLCPQLRCVHLGAATMSTLPDSKFAMNHEIRSQRYYVREYSDAAPLTIASHYLTSVFFKLCFNLQKKLK